MTTIVFDGKTLASDSQTTNGSTVASLKSKKIFKLNKNKKYKLVGFCGCVVNSKKMLSWFKGEIEEYPVGVDSVAMAITHKNKIHIYYDEPEYIVHEYKTASIGSGSDFANAAMMAGASAKESVKVAIKMDIYSGGRIQTIDVDFKK